MDSTHDTSANPAAKSMRPLEPSTSIDTRKSGHESMLSMKSALLGLAGASVVFLIQVVEIEAWDKPLTIAFYCFVSSIPLLVGFAIGVEAVSHTTGGEIPERGMHYFIGQWISGYGAVAGVFCYLWHYRSLGAWVFLGSCLAAAVIFPLFHATAIKEMTTAKDSAKT
jgi:hypothetical protein